MKIILLIGSKRWSFNRRINAGFVEKLASFHDIQLSVFDRTTIIQQHKSILEAYNKIKPDVFICYAKLGKSRFVDAASKINCPKIMIDVDYSHRPVALQKLYKACGFDLILQRGAFSRPKDFSIPWIWLPFSADQKIFQPDKPFLKRTNKIGFAGSLNHSYPTRVRAVNTLRGKQLLVVCRKCFGGKYTSFLKQYRSYFTSTELNSPHGKMFEIRNKIRRSLRGIP